MSFRTALALLLLLLAPAGADAAVTFVGDPASFQPGATRLGFEEQTAGGTLSSLTPDSFTVDFDGNAGSFPVVAYADLSGALATAATTAELGAKALRIDNGANQEIRFDPPVTRVGMYLSSSGSMLTNVTAFRDGVQTYPTQTSAAANTIQFLGFKDPDGIDRIVFSGDFVDSDPVLLDALLFQRLEPVLYHFRGAVTSLTDGGGVLGDDVAVGSPFTVSAVVTPEADDFNAFPPLAQYSQPENFPLTISLGGRTFTTSRFEMQVQNDNGDVDGFGFGENGPAVTVASPALDASVANVNPLIFLQTTDIGAFADTSIPEQTPDVGLFETNVVQLSGFSSGGSQIFSVQGSLIAQPPAFTVITTADSGLGSLRQAILDANATPGADTIVFDIPAGLCGPNGVCSIALASDLPAITEAVTIDATTQPRFGTAPGNVCATAEAPSSMRVSIDYPFGNAIFTIAPSSSAPVVVRGFALIGGGSDVQVSGAGAHRVQCNHLHVTAPGDALFYPGPPWYGIGVGIDQSAQGAIVGTDGDGVGDLAERNVVAGAGQGVYVNANADSRIAGNLFCLAADGTTSLGGTIGVLIRQSSNDNLVGTDWDGVSDALEGNVVAGCQTGIALGVTGGGPTGNVIAGNRIGLDGTGNVVGLTVQNAPSTVVDDNVFTGNESAIDLTGTSTLGEGSERNCIEGNLMGLSHAGDASLVFENNWWGDASGPSGVGPGAGDPIAVTGAGSVDFTPFATGGCQPVPEPGAMALGTGAAIGLAGLARRRARSS